MKKILAIIAILELGFVVSIGLNLVSKCIAKEGKYYVAGIMPSYQFGSRGYQVTNKVDIYDNSGCASFVSAGPNDYNWMATGFYQGHNIYGDFYTSPRYYYDGKLNNYYFFLDLGPASVDETHEYGVYLMTQYPDPNPGQMVAFRDSITLIQKNGFPKTSGPVDGESESHDTQNQMNYHFWNVKYATQGLYWYNFSNTLFYKDPPYYYTRISNTEWWAKGNP